MKANAHQERPVTIIGAGIVGICSALSLIEHGFRVAVRSTDGFGDDSVNDSKLLQVLCGPAVAGSTPRGLTWDDLVPEAAQDPKAVLAGLSAVQRDDIDFILRARELMKGGSRHGAGKLAIKIAEREDRLRQAGVHIDRQVARLRQAEEVWRAANAKANPSLNRKYVRLPGYVLPLEFVGTRVTEFLLVPFVGACLHVPPPPPNQVVYVRTRQAIDITGLYTPVHVTGYMRTRSDTAKSLFLTDGNVDVRYGYTLLAETVEIYSEAPPR